MKTHSYKHTQIHILYTYNCIYIFEYIYIWIYIYLYTYIILFHRYLIISFFVRLYRRQVVPRWTSCSASSAPASRIRRRPSRCTVAAAWDARPRWSGPTPYGTAASLRVPWGKWMVFLGGRWTIWIRYCAYCYIYIYIYKWCLCIMYIRFYLSIFIQGHH